LTQDSVYRRIEASERLRNEGAIGETFKALRGFLPLGERRFGARLAAALSEAERLKSGFYLGGFQARRALGEELVIEIDPARLEHRLEHRVGEGGRTYLIRDRFLGAGDWTPLLTLLRRSSTWREVEQIVQAGFDYRETRAYGWALKRAAAGSPVRRNFVALRSPEAVETYYRQTAELCRSIQEHGLRRRREVGRRFADFRVRRPWVELGEAEIGVAIGANGEIYRFASGKHRTAAAKALGIPSIPVEVRMVHAGWVRQLMERASLPPVEALLLGIGELTSGSR
jgi:hypothetical protein